MKKPAVSPEGARKCRRYYGHGIPRFPLEDLTGKLIVVEGADGSGRSTQIARLVDWLETCGHATVQVGLKHSTLVSADLAKAQEGNILSRTTLSLFYATDFADQLENMILPALKAGFIVLSDRYIYTLMARDIVRGLSRRWCHEVFGFAVIPDLVFYLDVEPEELVHRVFQIRSSLDYYESGMDLGLSEEMYGSFILYQRLIAAEFRRMRRKYGLIPVDAHRSVEEINLDLKARIDGFLGKNAP